MLLANYDSGDGNANELTQGVESPWRHDIGRKVRKWMRGNMIRDCK